VKSLNYYLSLRWFSQQDNVIQTKFVWPSVLNALEFSETLCNGKTSCEKNSVEILQGEIDGLNWLHRCIEFCVLCPITWINVTRRTIIHVAYIHVLLLDYKGFQVSKILLSTLKLSRPLLTKFAQLLEVWTWSYHFFPHFSRVHHVHTFHCDIWRQWRKW
jgi:hypothetical protein